MLGLPMRTATTLVHEEANVELLDDFCTKIFETFERRSQYVDNIEVQTLFS